MKNWRIVLEQGLLPRADGNEYIWISETLLESSSVELPTPSLVQVSKPVESLSTYRLHVAMQ